VLGCGDEQFIRLRTSQRLNRFVVFLENQPRTNCQLLAVAGQPDPATLAHDESAAQFPFEPTQVPADRGGRQVQRLSGPAYPRERDHGDKRPQCRDIEHRHVCSLPRHCSRNLNRLEVAIGRRQAQTHGPQASFDEARCTDRAVVRRGLPHRGRDSVGDVAVPGNRVEVCRVCGSPVGNPGHPAAAATNPGSSRARGHRRTAHPGRPVPRVVLGAGSRRVIGPRVVGDRAEPCGNRCVHGCAAGSSRIAKRSCGARPGHRRCPAGMRAADRA